MIWKVFRRLKSLSETKSTAEEAVVDEFAFDKTKGSQKGEVKWQKSCCH